MNKVIVTKEAFLEQMFKALKLNHIVKSAEELAALVEAKNHDYGDAWQRYGIFTPLIRINDKTLRLATLASGEQAMVADEKIEDTLKDIIAYAVLALMWLKANKENDNEV